MGKSWPKPTRTKLYQILRHQVIGWGSRTFSFGKVKNNSQVNRQKPEFGISDPLLTLRLTVIAKDSRYFSPNPLPNDLGLERLLMRRHPVLLIL